MRRPNAYDFQINATVPGSLDYLANESVFTTNATKNSPGVKVWGTPGNVSGTGSSVAKYAGIYEYFCIYHVALGMFGYLIVLLNSAYSGGQSSSESASTSATAASALQISIVQSASTNTNSAGFLGNSARVVVVLRSKSLSVPICFFATLLASVKGGFRQSVKHTTPYLLGATCK